MTANTSFLTARRGTDRTACERWLKAHGITPESVDYEPAKARWHDLPLLDDSELRKLALSALEGALGPPVDASTPFPSMLWYGGATDTWGGLRFNGTIGDFVTHVLKARACEIAQKRCGWVVTPTTNTDGHRVNASTTAMHALNLDSDGRGTWDRLVTVLDQLGLAYIAYQSGGWSPTTPKWHVLLPLAAPFDTSTPDRQKLWKTLYTSARVVFGTLAELCGEGFDPTVETPAIPIFITERRVEIDPPRQVLWRPGRSLDFYALALALPMPEPQEESYSPRTDVQTVVLDDDRLEEIVCALCEPMSKILSGRRDLYMSLPGALLDRGVKPDDVRIVIEEVSLRCPGDPLYTQSEVDSKHREHLHCLETTIGKYERGETYTRIGTLNESWSAVANVIDELFPDPFITNVIARLEARAARNADSSTPNVATAPVSIDLVALRRDLSSLRNRKMKSTSVDQMIRGSILDALLKGEDLVPYIVQPDGPPQPVCDADGKPIDREGALSMAMNMIAYKLSIGTPFEAVAVILKPSLHAMLRDGENVDVLLKPAERTFLRALGKRMDRQEKERADDLVEADRLSQYTTAELSKAKGG